MMQVVYRVAYAPMPDDPPDRQRNLRSFAAATHGLAESAAGKWAADRDQQRPPELRRQWPWVMERWDARSQGWELVRHLSEARCASAHCLRRCRT